jgi:uncharacterized protein YwgA
MTEILDYGLDSPARALLVLILAIEDRTRQKAMNKLHFQKAIYYFENLKQDQEVSFSNYKYGGVSFELTENMETLEESGLVTRVGTKYVLTLEGEKLAKELVREQDSETLNKLKYAKYLLNDLSDKELLFFMYMSFPETQVNSIEFGNLVKDKDNWTRRLFLKNRINATTAAQWLEMNQRDFLNSLPACDK